MSLEIVLGETGVALLSLVAGVLVAVIMSGVLENISKLL